MASSSNPDADRTTSSAESGLVPQEGQLLQSITNLQSQLDAMSQRQDELMHIVGVLREPQGGSASGSSSDVLARTDLPRGFDSYEARGPAPPAGGAGGEPSTCNRCPPRTSEQPLQIPVNRHSVPGRPATQQILPFQAQVRDLGRPRIYHFDPNGRPLIHTLPPPQCPLHPSPHPVPVFSQLHDRAGNVVGLVRQGSFSGAGPRVRHVPPGWNQLQTYQPPAHPQVQPSAHPQMPPRMIPQAPPQLHPEFQPQIVMQGSIPTNWGAPPGPPPPYPEPQAPTFRVDLNPEHDGSGLDLSHVQGGDNTGNNPTRANPPRRARPKDFSELE